MTEPNLIVVLGATASGKTRLAVQLARIINGEIISADSRQVYRGMDIGTGKDLSEYGQIPYHMIDIVEPGHEFNLFEFQRRFVEIFDGITCRGKLPLLVGGTGMYLDAVITAYRLVEVPENPELRAELDNLSLEELAERLGSSKGGLHNVTDLLDRNRMIRAIEIAEQQLKTPPPSFPEIRPLILGIRWNRDALRRRITERLKERLQSGMIQEVERLHDKGVPYEMLEFYGLEYRYVARYLKGELNRNDMFQKLNSAIHDFAKRQETWFRRMERRGILINWVEGAAEPLQEVLKILSRAGREE